MNAARSVLMALLVGVMGCADLSPTAPTPIARPTPPPPPRPPFTPTFPAVSQPARIFLAVEWPEYAYHGSQLASRYVLHEDGTFALQYSSVRYPFFEYRGTYTENGGAFSFDFGEPWGALGWLNGDSLTVEYNVFMQQVDFENGVYVRTQ